MDISEEVIKQMQDRNFLRPEMVWETGDLLNMKYPDEYFDVVFDKSSRSFTKQEEDQMLYYGTRYSQDTGSNEEDEEEDEYIGAEFGDEEFEEQDDCYHYHKRYIYGQDHADYRQNCSSEDRKHEIDEIDRSARSSEESSSRYFSKNRINTKHSQPGRVPAKPDQASDQNQDSSQNNSNPDDDIIIAEVVKKPWNWRNEFEEFYEEDYEADTENNQAKPDSNSGSEDESGRDGSSEHSQQSSFVQPVEKARCQKENTASEVCTRDANLTTETSKCRLKIKEANDLLFAYNTGIDFNK